MRLIQTRAIGSMYRRFKRTTADAEYEIIIYNDSMCRFVAKKYRRSYSFLSNNRIARYTRLVTVFSGYKKMSSAQCAVAIGLDKEQCDRLVH